LPEATAIALGVRGVGFFRRATASATRTLLSMSSEPQDLDWPGSTTESNLSVAVVDFLAIAVRLERIPYNVDRPDSALLGATRYVVGSVVRSRPVSST
jgi:hypothetical protein